MVKTAYRVGRSFRAGSRGGAARGETGIDWSARRRGAARDFADDMARAINPEALEPAVAFSASSVRSKQRPMS